MIPLFLDEQTPVPTRNALVQGALTLNNPADDPNDTYECNIYAASPQWDALTEPKSQGHGLEGLEPRKVVVMHRIDGVIRAPTLGRLWDKVLLLNETFDMVNTYDEDTAVHNRGYIPLTFSIPTEDITNYSSGLIPARINVRSLAAPVSRTSQFEGLTCRFSLLLQAADPRLYFATQQTVNRSNAGSMNAVNTLAGFPSPVILTVAFTGATSGLTSFEMGGRTLVLDFVGTDSPHVFTVDMEHQTIANEAEVTDMSVYSSGEFWQDLPKGTTTEIVIANVTGTLAATVTATWYRAL